MNLMVVKEFTFAAAHYLPGYQGKCANLHGHEWRLRIGISGEIQRHSGMVYDFSKLKTIVQENIIALLDHQCLNECKVSGFPELMPTAEYMVQWIVKLFQKKEEPTLELVQLWETPTSYCEWRRKELDTTQVQLCGTITGRTSSRISNISEFTKE